MSKRGYRKGEGDGAKKKLADSGYGFGVVGRFFSAQRNYGLTDEFPQMWRE